MNCVFCNIDDNLESEPLYDNYKHWSLLLQSEKKRKETKQAAGLLVTKRHVLDVSELSESESVELFKILDDANKRLCEAINATYTGDFTIGSNKGISAGQTVMHAHVHLLPVVEEDPEELKIRAGIGGAFEALRKERLGKTELAK